MEPKTQYVLSVVVFYQDTGGIYFSSQNGWNTEEECNKEYDKVCDKVDKHIKKFTTNKLYVTGCVMASDGYVNPLRSVKIG